MERAADRLARIRLLEDEQEEKDKVNRNKWGGKKSGSMLVASETVEERNDWPHLYVTRMTITAGERGSRIRNSRLRSLFLALY